MTPSSYLVPAFFVLLWSTGFIGARMGAPYSEPMTFLALRFTIVLILLLPLAIFSRAHWPAPKQALYAFLSGLMIHGMYLAGLFWAIDDGMPAGLAALIMGLQPVLTTFFARLLLKGIHHPKSHSGLSSWFGWHLHGAVTTPARRKFLRYAN